MAGTMNVMIAVVGVTIVVIFIGVNGGRAAKRIMSILSITIDINNYTIVIGYRRPHCLVFDHVVQKKTNTLSRGNNISFTWIPLLHVVYAAIIYKLFFPYPITIANSTKNIYN